MASLWRVVTLIYDLSSSTEILLSLIFTVSHAQIFRLL